jgi:hypothetical protein
MKAAVAADPTMADKEVGSRLATFRGKNELLTLRHFVRSAMKIIDADHDGLLAQRLCHPHARRLSAPKIRKKATLLSAPKVPPRVSR